MKIDRQLPTAFARLGNHEEYDWTPLPWKGIYNKVLFCDGVTGAGIARVSIISNTFNGNRFRVIIDIDDFPLKTYRFKD